MGKRVVVKVKRPHPGGTGELVTPQTDEPVPLTQQQGVEPQFYEQQQVVEPQFYEQPQTAEAQFYEQPKAVEQPRCYEQPQVVEPQFYERPQTAEAQCYEQPKAVEQPRCYAQPQPVEPKQCCERPQPVEPQCYDRAQIIEGGHLMLEWLKRAVELGASDIFIGAGRYISFRINGVIVQQGADTIPPDEAKRLITALYELAHRPMDGFVEHGDDDFPLTVPGLARFRANTYMQRSTMAAIIRIVLFNLPDYRELDIPDEVMKIATHTHGLVLVTGPAGSGKSTTLACVIDAINKSRNCHIITLEDPIEFLHRDAKSLVSQREISTDTESYMAALRACLRQVPDIILLGEMRDHETIKTAVTAAETGHLVISTLHTVGASNTIDRIIDIFPPQHQQQIRIQLSMALQMVVTQKLIPDALGKSVPAFEIMHINKAISNLIREAKTHQIDGVIQTSAQEGMISMDSYILKLFRDGRITAESAIGNAMNAEQMARMVGR